MTNLELLGYSAGILTTLSFYPQLTRIIHRQSAEDISYGMYALFSLGLILWLIYGFATHALPIILANSVTLILAFIILLLKFYFDKSK